MTGATRLSRIRPLHSLHGDALPWPPRVPLLRHPLAVRSKGPHSRSSSLVHAHGRPAHVRVAHGRCHAGWIHAPGGPSGSWLVHELVVVGLSGAHLEGRAHLEAKCEISGFSWMTFDFCSDSVSRREAVPVHTGSCPYSGFPAELPPWPLPWPLQ